MIAATAVVLAAGVEARVYSGNGKPERAVGSKRADRMQLRGGNDRARGLAGSDRIRAGAGNDIVRGNAGNDVLSGGKGRDRLLGGTGNDRVYGGPHADGLYGNAGRDRLLGGPGNDLLHAADGRKDVRVAGGTGRNTCRIDSVDLPVVSGCSKIVTVDGTRNLGGGGGGGGGGGDTGDLSGGTDLPVDLPVDDPTGAMGLASGSGLQCNSALPVCPFTLTGTGADEPTGTVTPRGGVGTIVGGMVAAVGEDWTATGMYGCTSDGYLRVTVGTEQLDVPVDCV